MRVWRVAQEQSRCGKCRRLIKPGEQVNKEGKQRAWRHNVCRDNAECKRTS